MTKEEIRTLIQGITKENTTEVLHADILTALLDMIPEGGGSSLKEVPRMIKETTNLTMSEFTSLTGLGFDDLMKFISGEYIGVKLPSEINLATQSWFIDESNDGLILFGDLGLNGGALEEWDFDETHVSVHFQEI